MCFRMLLLAYLPPRPSPTSDRVKRVLEGKAVVRVVNVDGPLSSFATLVRASGLVADKSLSTRVCRRQRVREWERERERLELGCAICLWRA